LIDTSSRLSIDRDRGDISYAFDPYDPGGNILVNRVISDIGPSIKGSSIKDRWATSRGLPREASTIV
jgi:hypothetical protein